MALSKRIGLRAGRWPLRCQQHGTLAPGSCGETASYKWGEIRHQLSLT